MISQLLQRATRTNQLRRRWVWMGAILLLTIFCADITLTGINFAHGMLYGAVIVVAALTLNIVILHYFSVSAIFLTLLGIWISPEAYYLIEYDYVLANRLVSVALLILLWGCLYQSVKYVQHIKKNGEVAKLKQAEEQERMNLLKIAGEVAKFGGWSLTLNDNIVRWSGEVADILSLPKHGECTAATALQFFASEHRAKVKHRLRLCVEDGTPFDEEWLVAIGGGCGHWIRLIGQPKYDDKECVVGVFGAVQEINKYKSVECNLQLSQQRFRQLADAMPLIVWTSDAAGNMDFFNRNVVKVTGCQLDDLLNEDGWLTLLHPDDVGPALQRWSHALENPDKPYQNEFRVRHYDQSYHWYVAQGTPVRSQNGEVVRWYGSAVDVQLYKQKQQELIELAQQFEHTLAGLPEAFLIFDTGWRLTYMNRQAEELLSKRTARFLYSPFEQLFPDISVSSLTQQLEDKPLKPKLYKVDAGEGSSSWLSISCFQIESKINLLVQDVTDTKLLEERLVHNQRLESIGRLTGGVAHDFNNLLTVIQGNAGVLTDKLKDNAALGNYARLIDEAAEKAAHLTHQLLSYARKQTLMPSVISLGRLVKENQTLLERTLGEQIEICFELHDENAEVFLDPTQLESALLNLVVNAKDAMPEGGRLEISTKQLCASAVEQILVPPLTETDYVVLRVVDNGSGIESEHLERVFEPFFTTKDVDHGSGLGLSMVFGFVSQSGGSVGLESEVGCGTSVSLYFPVIQEQPEKNLSETETHKSEVITCTENRPVVLLVEDEPLVREFAETLLLEAGYIVLSAKDAKQAIELLEARQSVDLLFTDLIMPGTMNGLQLANHVATRFPQAKILLCTGYSQTDRSGVTEELQFPLLKKPYKRATLLSALSNLPSADHVS